MRSLSFVLTLLMICSSLVEASSWPRFRGPNGSGVAASDEPLPSAIGPDKNVLWKAAVAPGRSSPVVANGRLYLTGIRDGDQPVTICFDSSSGSLLWEQPAPQRETRTLAHGGDHAQATCAASDEYVLSYFESSGLLCYDRDGQLIWKSEFAPFETQYGVGSSPIIADGRVILCQDLDTGSFLTALNLEDGKPLWRIERPNFIANFVTPVIWEVAGKQQIVLPGSLLVIGYDLETGEQLWQVRGVSWSVISTPVFDEQGTLFVNAKAPGEVDGAIPLPPFADALRNSDGDGSGTFNRQEFLEFGPRSSFFPTLDRDKDGQITREEYDYVDNLWSSSKDVLLAIQPGGSGDITDTHVKWKFERSLPFCPSPLYHAGHIYTVKSLGIVNCLLSDTGERTAKERRITSRGDYYSSPVLGDGKIFVASERGELSVINADPDWREISHVKFDEDIYATPAIVAGRIFLRTTESLYCFGYPDLEVARAERDRASVASGGKGLAIGIVAALSMGAFCLVWWSRSRRRKH